MLLLYSTWMAMRNKIEIKLKPLRAYGIVFVIFFFFFIATGARENLFRAPRRWNVGRAWAFPRLAFAAPNCLVVL